jgi:hypothetical protein
MAAIHARHGRKAVGDAGEADRALSPRLEPLAAVHRRLLTRVQEHAIAARPDFAFVTLIKRYIDGHGAPYKEYVTSSATAPVAPIT